jgi:hypothetical protein
MVRTQIQLEESQMEALQEMSSASGQSIADLVRQAVDRLLTSRHGISPEERIERTTKTISTIFRPRKLDSGCLKKGSFS